MKHRFTLEIIIGAILIGLLILISNPYDIFMPSMMLETIAGASVVVFGLFASLLLKEKVHDEREEKHRGLAGRLAFLTGSGVLLLGIVVEVFNDTLDFWLVLGLVTMIIVKIGVRMYSEKYL